LNAELVWFGTFAAAEAVEAADAVDTEVEAGDTAESKEAKEETGMEEAPAEEAGDGYQLPFAGEEGCHGRIGWGCFGPGEETTSAVGTRPKGVGDAGFRPTRNGEEVEADHTEDVDIEETCLLCALTPECSLLLLLEVVVDDVATEGKKVWVIPLGDAATRDTSLLLLLSLLGPEAAAILALPVLLAL